MLLACFYAEIILLLRKSTKIIASRAALFGSDINQTAAQTPLGELTVLPQIPWLYLGGLLLREGRKGRGGKKKMGEGRRREGTYQDDAPQTKLPKYHCM